VGEQYVDLRPRRAGPPYLRNGAVIAMGDTTIPQRVGPMLDRVSALLNTIPRDRVSGLLDESFRGFNGAGEDMGSLIDSSSTFMAAVNAAGDRPRALVADSEPLLQSQADTADAIRTWTHSLADVTDQLTADDGHVRTLLQTGPGAAQELTRLLDQVKPTLPVLLANLTSIGKIGVTYNASLEQLLVLLPPFVAAVQSALPGNNPTGIAIGEFRLAMGDPPACTVGYLPPSSWRSPADTTEVDTPDGLYCKLPQDAPIAIRGARNYPCMGHPGKRAPTVQICDSDKPFEPVAQRQHALGPYPLDPNLISQGVPPDDRVDFGDNIFGPTGGTPPPPEMAPPEPEIPIAVPSSHEITDAAPAPSVAIAQYSPSTGQFVTPDGHAYRQSDLVTSPKTWKDLMPVGG
jgi:ABC-type transporter Mla subunit MlaD